MAGAMPGNGSNGWSYAWFFSTPWVQLGAWLRYETNDQGYELGMPKRRTTQAVPMPWLCQNSMPKL